MMPSAAALPKNPFIIAYTDRRLDAAAQIVIDTIKEVAATHMMNFAHKASPSSQVSSRDE